MVKLTVMGRFCLDAIASAPLTEGRPSSARVVNSLPPPNCFLIFHIIADFSGCHLTPPAVVLTFGESTSSGTGITISTLLAADFFLNWARALTMISIRDDEKLTILQSTQINGFTGVFNRYDIKFEFSIRWNERYCSVIFKSR
jgi:hypothetical protein